MYADGIGVKDEILARRYFEKAASSGDNRASFNLAMMEEQKKNYVGAYQWYELSTRDGMLDTKVINLSEGKKTALAANLTQNRFVWHVTVQTNGFRPNNLKLVFKAPSGAFYGLNKAFDLR